ncbi:MULTISPECIES: hypothetical protein [unclassified Modestobacter]|uniref:hypothetical protein n=1 Tax=unclassified Modestobacter TaxID=2643866 RepID=UPI0022AAC8ED|nr:MULTISPECIES: hypothetical protein [unclassified Modestobacter]MCZ2824688.1 hypothetical protein [Modestobacter sp. VKM Ac-2981]MCZ2854809.1 hypothetical protein [Modestobacter sp. VKM Ac-2982]
MTTLSNRSRAAGAAVVGLAVLAGGWLLVVDPIRAETASIRESAELLTVQNDARELALIGLADQFEHLDEHRAELAGLQASIPAQADLPGLTRRLQETAQNTGLTIVQLTTATPVPVEAPAPAVGAEGSTTGAVSDGSTPAVAVLSMQVSVSVIGSSDAVESFVSELQTGTDRLLLISGLTATSQDAAIAGGGRPATATGDVEASFTTYAFTMAPTVGDATAAAGE